MTRRFAEQFDEIAQRHRPTGPFDAVAFSSNLVREMIMTAFLGARFPEAVLRKYVAPLDGPMPQPLLRRPFRVRRMERALRETFTDPDPSTLSPLFAALPGGVEEARVAVAAAYDTTAHAMAFALWELAARPELNVPEAAAGVVQRGAAAVPVGLDRQPGRHPGLANSTGIRSRPAGWCSTAPT